RLPCSLSQSILHCTASANDQLALQSKVVRLLTRFLFVASPAARLSVGSHLRQNCTIPRRKRSIACELLYSDDKGAELAKRGPCSADRFAPAQRQAEFWP